MASMASSSSSKRKACDLELVSLGRASYASHSAISKLLAHISEHGPPETYDRSAQFRARKDICRKDVNGYGPLVVELLIGKWLHRRVDMSLGIFRTPWLLSYIIANILLNTREL